MAKLRLLALAGIPVVSCGWANAADLPPAPSLPEQAAMEEFSGWYLRGDVGGGVNSARPELEAAPGVIAANADDGLLSGAAAQRFDQLKSSDRVSQQSPWRWAGRMRWRVRIGAIQLGHKLQGLIAEAWGGEARFDEGDAVLRRDV